MSRSIQDRIFQFIEAHNGVAVSFADIRLKLQLPREVTKYEIARLRQYGRIVYRHGEGYRVTPAAMTPIYTGSILDVLMPREVERTVRCRKVKGVMA